MLTIPSTHRGIIKAMGGKLEIRAIFPDGVVRINQFQDLKRTA
jgi:gamma-glutamyl-gamma-aminobutyrate hydrolase PuuD